MQYRDSFYICAPSEKLKYQESPLSQKYLVLYQIKIQFWSITALSK